MKKYIKANISKLLLAVFFSIIYAVIFYFMMNNMGKVIDAAVKGNMVLLREKALWALLFLILWPFGGYLMMSATSTFSNSTALSLNKDYSESIFSIPTHIYNKNSDDYYINLMNEDLNILRTQYFGTLAITINYFVQIVVFLVGLFLISPFFCLLSLVFSILPFFVSKFFSGKLQKTQMDVSQGNEANLHGTKELIFGRNAIKQSSNEEKFINRYLIILDNNLSIKKRLTVLMNFANDSMRSIGSISQLVILALGGFFIVKGKVTTGDLIMSMSFITCVSDAVGNAIENINNIRSTKDVGDKFLNMLKSNEELPKGRALALEAGKVKDGVSVKNFSFAFGDRDIFKNFSYELADRCAYAVIGESGSGKTTIVEAILNYNKRYKGKIYINGDELKELSYSDIVYIPADYLISNFGVLEDKAKMSSGQRKKAQFVLSLLTDKSVYIIDEPTNFLDLENKEAIARLISDLYDKGKIIIMITHDKDIMNKLNNVETIYLERKVVA